MDNRSNLTPVVAIAAGVLLTSVSVLSPVVAQDDTRSDTIAACAEASKLLEADDIDGALDEAQWCLEGIQQVKESQTLAVFPDSVDGYRGGEVTSNRALGMVVLGREYTKGNKEIELSLTSGAVAGLGSLGQLMSAFGSLGDGKKYRIQRRTVIDSSAGQGANLIVQLKSGGMMTVKSTSVSGEEAVEFLKAFPIAELDDAIAE